MQYVYFAVLMWMVRFFLGGIGFRDSRWAGRLAACFEVLAEY